MIPARQRTRTAPVGLGRRGRCFVLGAPSRPAPALLVRVAFVLRAVALLVVIEAGLRRGTLRDLCDRLGVELRPGPADGAEPPTGEVPWAHLHRAASRSERVMRRWPFESTCLRRCLLWGALLRDHRPGLVLGVRRDPDGALVAHSWLEIAGRSVDPTSTTFAPFAIG